MDYDQISQMLSMVALAGPPVLTVILKFLGTLVVLAQSLVPIFPSPSNTEKWEAIKKKAVIGPILMALMKFSVVNKK